MKTSAQARRPIDKPMPQSSRTVDDDAGRERVMGADPLQDSVLDHFYRPRPQASVRPDAAALASVAADAKPKPTHYRIVCISLYNEDIQRLETMVAELKRRGHTKANKSQLIRAALDQVDLDKVPKGY